jgi:membrane-associated phospholipid phosphatase
MLPEYGFLDTQQVYSNGLYNRTFILSFYNPYAAMPSLHFGLTLLVGIMAYSFDRRAFKISGVLYPSVMALVIVITGHHYFLDIVGGGIVIGLAYALVYALPHVAQELASSPAVIGSSFSYWGERPHARSARPLPDLRVSSWSREQLKQAQRRKDRLTSMAMMITRGSLL